ncbi:MAG: hypothetical protein KDC05_06615 [Bacteroidales bacterium]|nr:hypothetical protein [Bacteroidales bacterium]
MKGWNGGMLEGWNVACPTEVIQAGKDGMLPARLKSFRRGRMECWNEVSQAGLPEYANRRRREGLTKRWFRHSTKSNQSIKLSQLK